MHVSRSGWPSRPPPYRRVLGPKACSAWKYFKRSQVRLRRFVRPAFECCRLYWNHQQLQHYLRVKYPEDGVKSERLGMSQSRQCLLLSTLTLSRHVGSSRSLMVSSTENSTSRADTYCLAACYENKVCCSHSVTTHDTNFDRPSYS